jgi:hypothetical protein
MRIRLIKKNQQLSREKPDQEKLKRRARIVVQSWVDEFKIKQTGK